MSSSIQIPRRRRKVTDLERDQAASASSNSSSPAFSPSTPTSRFGTSFGISSGSLPKNEGEVGLPAAAARPARRLSLLSSSLAKAEHTVVNVGSPDAPRLITCVKASQGFDWNQDIFLPSYLEHDSEDLEHRQQPVQEIILTDEEAAALLPQ
ncbi:hypothetical protein E2P81_ATG11495 [Venturia nashicola]|uniref:Uncharacterized protein n=1 Tax=Venturia nashicola TaxID=86259 RepID=A0A4Z1PJN4_9PEZI|nr:hypothetical protein E6O75_ATG11186 [Venturia nashicola]TLD35376.1 hypothetical protein E2P81_ATG11495 [Venturia nashicola]